MRFSWRAAVMLILALFLVSASFADEKKTDKKSDDSSTSTSDGSAVQPAKDAPTPASPGGSGNVTPAFKPPAKSGAAMAQDTGEEASESPKWVPMPAWNGNPGLF